MKERAAIITGLALALVSVAAIIASSWPGFIERVLAHGIWPDRVWEAVGFLWIHVMWLGGAWLLIYTIRNK